MSSTSAAPQESWARRPQEVASVIAVCIVFLILSYYSILKRLFCIATSPRNQGRRRLLNESIGDDPSLQFRSHGLEVSIIHSLPMSQFKKSEAEEKPINTDCAICLGEFEEGEWLKHLPNCNHVFHVSCIDTWFQSHSNCPLCRSHAHRHPSVNLECSISTFTMLETSRREDFIQERAANFQSIRPATLHNSGITHQSSND